MRKSGLLGGVLFVMVVVGCGGAYKGEASSPASESRGEAGVVAPAGDSASSPAGVQAQRTATAAFEASAGAPVAGPASPARASKESSPVALTSPPAPAAPAIPSPRLASPSSLAEAALASAPKVEARRPLPQSGQLTAGVWDDNRNFDFFKPYASTFRQRNAEDFAMFAEQELTTARDLANADRGPRSELDVQLVLDTTGSMGDELSYLQSEFDAIAAKIRSRFPNVTPRWSLVLYRDKGDDYVTREFDFTTDTIRFRKNLLAQSAGGGGDVPEAVVEGLFVGLNQSWRRQGSVAKVAFWVADAPAHPGEGKVLANVIRDARKKGVRIYPIASSDTNDAAE